MKLHHRGRMKKLRSLVQIINCSPYISRTKVKKFLTPLELKRFRKKFGFFKFLVKKKIKGKFVRKNGKFVRVKKWYAFFWHIESILVKEKK